MRTIEFEARRVAAAFGLDSCCPVTVMPRVFYGHDAKRRVDVRWSISERRMEMVSLQIVSECDSAYLIMRSDGTWGLSKPLYREAEKLELLALGLYCLGFEDEGVLSQLPRFTAHEKVEIRHSLPREFWPQSWLDEEIS